LVPMPDIHTDASEGFDSREMRVAAERAALEDGVYYWLDNVRFLVQGILFRVPRLPFILGSRYFTEKHGLHSNGVEAAAEPIIHLRSVSAPQFRVFLKFLFPMPSNKPLESIFTKEEWITILSLCTAWHFPEFRKLAIQSLDGKLAELELIHVGRALCIPIFVLEGYRAIINRPTTKIITKEEATVIGHESVNKLWIIRYQIQVAGVALDEEAMGRELHENFAEELAELVRDDPEGRVPPEMVREWAGVPEDESRMGKDMRGSVSPHEFQGEDEAKGQERVPLDAKSSVPWADFLGPPACPRPRDITRDPAGWWDASDGEMKREMEEVQLAGCLQDLKGEEREIRRKLQEAQSREQSLEGGVDTESVKHARLERIKEELRKIEEVKRVEKELTRSLGNRKMWFGPDIDLWIRLEDVRNRRRELKQRIIDGGAVEDDQSLRWDKAKALVQLNTELRYCQVKQQMLEKRLNELNGVGGGKTLDASGVNSTAAEHEKDTKSVTIVERELLVVCEGEKDEATQKAERRKTLEDEQKHVRRVKQVQLQKETKLRAQEAQYSNSFSKRERLLSQSDPASCSPKKVKQREKKQRKCAKNLRKVQTELKEVSGLLNIVRGEEARLENEIRLL
ncbi:hypothetical protein FA13DRAFT_1725734, partial [Coprinellus micaceus]